MVEEQKVADGALATDSNAIMFDDYVIALPLHNTTAQLAFVPIELDQSDLTPDLTPQKIGPEFQVNDVTEGDQTYQDIIGLEGGGFVATWQSLTDSSQAPMIKGQVFDLDGAVGDEFMINSHTAYGKTTPEVAPLTNGGFVATWTSTVRYNLGNGVFMGNSMMLLAIQLEQNFEFLTQVPAVKNILPSLRWKMVDW